MRHCPKYGIIYMRVKTPLLGRPRFIQEDFLCPMITANRILDGAANEARIFDLVWSKCVNFLAIMCGFPKTK